MLRKPVILPAGSRTLGAVILAAGKGSRLGDLTASIPKTLLVVGENGETMLDLLLESCSAAGIGCVDVMGGYACDVLAAHLRARRTPPSTRISLFPDFDRVNNIGTFVHARDVLSRGALLFNSDIVIEPALAQHAALQARRCPDQSFMVIDDIAPPDAEQMKCIVKDGRITSLSKNIPLEDSAGEYIGITYLAPLDARAVISEAARMLAAGETGSYYECAITRMLDTSVVRPLSTAGALWTEVDTTDDLSRARGIVQRLAERELRP